MTNNIIQETRLILAQAYNEHHPIIILPCFSGGHDSIVSTDITWQWAKGKGVPCKVVAVDTLLSADGWREYIQRVADGQGWDLEIWDTVNPDWYEQNALEYGFGHTPSLHIVHFRALKERSFDAILRHYKTGPRTRVLFVTGVRRDESKRRANKPVVSRDGNSVIVNPMVEWTKADIGRYRIEHELPANPFYAKGLGSGDCMCNVPHHTTLTNLLAQSPCLGARIAVLNEQVKAIHGYGWDEEPEKTPAWAIQEDAGQLRLFNGSSFFPECIGCATNSRKRAESEENAYLAEVEW